MTKQELEKAIEKGESVWCLYQSHKEIEEMYFSKENKYKFMDVKYIDGGTELCLVVNNDWYYPLKYLFKTKAEAEHYLHHANVTRTETLPFLSWEEFKSGKDITFKAKNGHEFLLKSQQESIYLWWLETNNIWASWDLTEENFYKAYDECVRLFRGGDSMKVINIDKERNEAIINYNGKEILSATIERFFFVKNKLHIKVKLPDWCCNGQYGLFDISDKFELLKKEQL